MDLKNIMGVGGGGGEPLPSGVSSVPCLLGRTGEQ